jgi:hypothetical protein
MHCDSTGEGSFHGEDASQDSLSGGCWERPRGRRRRKSPLGSVSRLNELRGAGQKRPKFKRSPSKTHEVTLSLTPRQAVVWLMNLDSISDLYEMTTGEILKPESRAQLRAVLRALAREGSGATKR